MLIRLLLIGLLLVDLLLLLIGLLRIGCLVNLLRRISLNLLLLRLHHYLFSVNWGACYTRSTGRRNGGRLARHGMKASLAMTMKRDTMQDESNDVNDPSLC